MATVQKRGKRWYAVYKDRAGKWRQKRGYSDKTETVKLAQRLEDEAYAISIGDVDPQADARRVERAKPAADHLAMFTAHMESKGCHANHVQYTAKDIQRFIDHSGVKSAAAVTLPLVDAWRSFCTATGYPKSAKGTESTPDSPKTANRRVASVQAWLRYLHGLGALERVVINTRKSGNFKMLATEGHETFHRRALTAEEAAALIAKCPDDGRRELYRFALYTGLRRSECASMTPAAMNFTQKTITISARAAKAKKEQIIPMHSCLVEPLKTLCGGKPVDAPLFHVPNRTDVVETLHGDCRAAGVDPKDVDFHGLRHTFCSLLAAKGIRPELLKKLARHRDVATTFKYYVHDRSDDERAALERL